MALPLKPTPDSVYEAIVAAMHHEWDYTYFEQPQVRRLQNVIKKGINDAFGVPTE